MTQTLDAPATSPRPRTGWTPGCADFESALTARDVDRAAGMFAADQLLARPRRVHLEPQDRREPRRGRRPAARDPGPDRPERLPHLRAAGRGRRGDHRVDRVRDRGRPRPRAAAARRRGQGVDAAHHPLRAQGPRGAEGTARARRAPSTARTATGRPGPSARAGGGASSATRPSRTSSSSAAGRAASRSAPGCGSSGCPTIIVDKRARPGDQWRSRYKSLCLHDPVWYDHLPYIKFPDNWPVFSPKDKIADWLESYTKVMELNYWSNTEAKSASYDEKTGEWTVEVEREGQPRRAEAEAAGARDRDVRQAEHPDDRGDGHVPRRPAPLLGAPRPGRVRRQEGRRDRVEQLGLRHLRGAVGEGRRRHDGAALVDPHRALGLADGHRARRALLRGGAWRPA